MKPEYSLEEFLSICRDSDTSLTDWQIWIAKRAIEARNKNQYLYCMPARQCGRSMIKALLKTYFIEKENTNECNQSINW